MRKYATYYFIWLAGVLSFAALAYTFYRRIEHMGVDAALAELHGRPPGEDDGVPGSG